MQNLYLYYIIIILLIVLTVINIVNLLKKDKTNQLCEKLKKLQDEMEQYTDKSKRDTLDFLSRQQALQNQNQQSVQLMEDARFNTFNETTQNNIDTLRKTVNEMASGLDLRFARFQKQNETQLSEMRATVEKKIGDMQESNEKKLEEMRNTVDEKLQKTLEDRISQSFKAVNERLEQVYKSLGEMQKVGEGVADLRKSLSNVKARGIFGEIQLGAILEEIMTPEQYATNVITKKGSADPVEFAIKLPAEDDGVVYLPIDSKFPLDRYNQLIDAYDSGNQLEIKQAVSDFKAAIKKCGKDISSKYIDVPNTTEFAIMFLPTEGLYAEIVRHGMLEELRKDNINIAGPTTLAALLNSLQMGFRTLAIQKNSGQVWRVLGEVKSEFAKFETVIDKAQKKMQAASRDLDDLVGTRTRAINRKLRGVEMYTLDENSDFEEIE